ncbi:MAG: SDR family oxidoreductase [Rickettsiales bacterium]
MGKLHAFPTKQAPQHQDHQPGITDEMRPKPQDHMERYQAAGKLKGKNALITGGDSGIGRAVAIGFAKEGANVAINYLEENEDAQETKRAVEAEGVKCVLIQGDLSHHEFCDKLAKEAKEALGHIHILVNNAAEQHEAEDFEDIPEAQIQQTFATNLFGAMYLTQKILPDMKAGDCIINTASITAYYGNKTLIDYSMTKGALVSFTRSLSQSLAKKNIRVNAVAPGPIWTPLIPASFDSEKVEKFGSQTPMGRAGQPDEVAPAYIFLASDDASYITGQVIHPNGGSIING